MTNTMNASATNLDCDFDAMCSFTAHTRDELHAHELTHWADADDDHAFCDDCAEDDSCFDVDPGADDRD